MWSLPISESFFDYFPQLHDVASLAGVFVAAAAMCSIGSIVAGRQAFPEVRLIVGWGALCLLLTVWGTLTASSFLLPLAAFAAIALTRAPVAKEEIGNVGRMALLTLPLWLVMLPVKPSQVDTWLNLLPNAAYLVDHNVFPADSRAESYSFLPGAPYNTQFVAYAASQVTRSFAESALSYFNILLQCATGLLFARLLVPALGGNAGRDLPWGVLAAGLLLSMPFNPGFSPRIFFGSYGEAPLAVTLAFAVWLGSQLLERSVKGGLWRSDASALAFVLLALIDIKQSGIGLVAAFCVGLLTAGLLRPAGFGKARFALIVSAVAVPALIEYGVWRWFVLSQFAAGELKPLPFSQWHFDLLPQICTAIGLAILKVPTYFVLVLAVCIVALIAIRQRPWTQAASVLCIVAVVVLVFNGYLLTAYVGHFPPEWAIRAHAYFRYMSQLSLAAMLALIMRVAPKAIAIFTHHFRIKSRFVPAAAITMASILPVLFVPLLRFDLLPPEPQLRALARQLADQVGASDKLGLLLPADGEDYAGSLMRGMLMFLPPRLHPLDFKTVPKADAQTLESMKAEGYSHVFVSCTPETVLAGIAPGVGALLSWEHGSWHQIGDWRYPHFALQAPWSHLLPRKTFCAA